MIQLSCSQCGAEFEVEVRKGSRKYCALQCQKRAAHLARTARAAAKGFCAHCKARPRTTGTRCETCVEYAKHWSRLKKTGWTRERFERAVVEQGNRCFLCRRARPSGKALNADHHHKTGEPRRLLCSTCNYRTVGYFETNPDYLGRVLAYIDRDILITALEFVERSDSERSLVA